MHSVISRHDAACAETPLCKKAVILISQVYSCHCNKFVTYKE
jgi:hypothetical protein